MSDSPSIVPDAASRLFDDYLGCLHKASVPEQQRRWQVKRVEDFIKAQNGRKIKTLSGAVIAGYLETIGRENRLSGWPFRQCVDAIRILYCAYPLGQTPLKCHTVVKSIGPDPIDSVDSLIRGTRNGN